MRWTQYQYLWPCSSLSSVPGLGRSIRQRIEDVAGEPVATDMSSTAHVSVTMDLNNNPTTSSISMHSPAYVLGTMNLSNHTTTSSITTHSPAHVVLPYFAVVSWRLILAPRTSPLSSKHVLALRLQTRRAQNLRANVNRKHSLPGYTNATWRGVWL